MNSLDLSQQIEAWLDDKQARETTCTKVPREHACLLADYLIVTSGNSERQLVSIANHLRFQLKNLGILPAIQGMGQSPWVIVDAGSIIVHLFLPETRKLYDLENWWSQGSFDTRPGLDTQQTFKFFDDATTSFDA